MNIGLLRFKTCIKNALRYKNCAAMEFGGFANSVLEHVFQMPKEARGTINLIVYSPANEAGYSVLDRMARIDVKRDGKLCFFYVFGEANENALQEWKITGRSIILDGALRMPNFETEMIWIK